MNKKTGLFRDAGGRDFFWTFALVTSLFFLWGFAHSILDVLNKHFQETLHVSKAESGLVQTVVYGGYFLMALPASCIIRRFGYRTAVVTGLLLYATGALLFWPGGRLLSFPFFLFSLFIIGCGLTCLETAANPYVTVLGHPRDAERRINLAQSFNGLGWLVGPLVGAWFLFGGDGGEADIAMPYIIIGVAVLVAAALFARAPLPEIAAPAPAAGSDGAAASARPLWRRPLFLCGMAALFLYVAAQTGINSFFINYVTETSGLSNAQAALCLSFGGMGLFMAGRMGGSWLMGLVRAERLLLGCALGAAAAMGVLLTGQGTAGIAAFFVCYLCESIMFPTIFALALRGAEDRREWASSLLIMCIVGGAVSPVAMGAIADAGHIAQAFSVPLLCFTGIALYALRLLRGGGRA